MAFRFRLQAVLQHREYLEEMARHEFAAELAKQNQCEQHIAWLEEEHTRAREVMEQREIKGMPAKDFILANEYATVLRLQAMREQARLPMLRAKTSQAREKLVEATRDKKAMESLKKKHRARWEQDQLRMEQKILDEAAVSAFARREV